MIMKHGPVRETAQENVTANYIPAAWYAPLPFGESLHA